MMSGGLKTRPRHEIGLLQLGPVLAGSVTSPSTRGHGTGGGRARRRTRRSSSSARAQAKRHRGPLATRLRLAIGAWPGAQHAPGRSPATRAHTSPTFSCAVWRLRRRRRGEGTERHSEALRLWPGAELCHWHAGPQQLQEGRDGLPHLGLPPCWRHRDGTARAQDCWALGKCWSSGLRQLHLKSSGTKQTEPETNPPEGP